MFDIFDYVTEKNLKIDIIWNKSAKRWMLDNQQFVNDDDTILLYFTKGSFEGYHYEFQDKDQNLHNSNGPAAISPDHIEWCIHGRRHRDNAPAFKSNNSEKWYVNGKLHRENGPAMTYFNICEYWYINDKNITDEVKEWLTENNINWKNMTNEHLIEFKLKFL